MEKKSIFTKNYQPWDAQIRILLTSKLGDTLERSSTKEGHLDACLTHINKVKSLQASPRALRITAVTSWTRTIPAHRHGRDAAADAATLGQSLASRCFLLRTKEVSPKDPKRSKHCVALPRPFLLPTRWLTRGSRGEFWRTGSSRLTGSVRVCARAKFSKHRGGRKFELYPSPHRKTEVDTGRGVKATGTCPSGAVVCAFVIWLRKTKTTAGPSMNTRRAERSRCEILGLTHSQAQHGSAL